MDARKASKPGKPGGHRSGGRGGGDMKHGGGGDGAAGHRSRHKADMRKGGGGSHASYPYADPHSAVLAGRRKVQALVIWIGSEKTWPLMQVRGPVCFLHAQ